MNVHWVTKPDGYIEPKITQFGQSSIAAKTVTQVFQDTVRKHGNRPALHLKTPVEGVIPNDWKIWTWKEYWDDCYTFAGALYALGIKPFQIINILGFNSVSKWMDGLIFIFIICFICLKCIYVISINYKLLMI